MRITREAVDAARRAGFSRRDFLKGAGILVVAYSSARGSEPILLGQGPFDTHASHVDPKQLDSWIAVSSDGAVTAFTGKCELGQGMLTAQTQLVAEELSVPLARVRLVQCDTDRCPDQGTTSGSQSTPSNFNDRNLAQAAAAARDALLKLGAERLNTPVDELVAVEGAVALRKDRTKRVTYGDLVGGRKFSVTVGTSARRKAASEWTVLGRPVPRLDMPAMATGDLEYVHTVHVPGMMHGRVVRPPSVGATLIDVDESSIRSIPGARVVVRKNFVGVVAERQYEAAQAVGRLKVRWSEGPALPNQRDFYDYLRSAMPSRDAFVVNSNDVDDRLARSSSVIKATYLHPYQAHASMGASCAVADVRSDRATVWSPTQSVYPTRNGVAALLGLPVDAVRVIYTRGAGCYGLNGADTVSYDAALLSRGAGRPVRVQLSRSDEFAWENYGYAYVIEQRAGVGADGTIVAWDYQAWWPSRGNRPGYDKPGNVVTGWLAGFEPDVIVARPAGDAADRFRNGSNAAPSYVSGCVGGSCDGAGTIRSERVLTHTVNSPFFTGPLRSPSRLQNTFAHESFMDEIAAHVKADPVAFRIRHLRDNRLVEVVRQAAAKAVWEARPSPKASSGATASGRGVACVAYEGDNGYAAMVADVEVDRATGGVRVKRFVVAQDCGPVSNPDGLRNQIEGGTLQGMSRAMGEEVTWEDRRVTSVDWRTYHSLPLGFDVPLVESVLVNRTDVPATGAGETAISLVAAAIGNAIFDATGARVRQVPFTPARVKAALGARTSQ